MKNILTFVVGFVLIANPAFAYAGSYGHGNHGGNDGHNNGGYNHDHDYDHENDNDSDDNTDNEETPDNSEVSNCWCVTPDSMGDNETNYVNFHEGGNSLGDILNANGASDKNPYDDQEQFQSWFNNPAGTKMKIDFLAKRNADFDHVLGYITGSDESTFVPVFKDGETSAYSEAPLFSEGNSTEVTLEAGKNYSFALSIDGENDTNYFVHTINDLNTNGEDQAVVYKIAPDTYIVAFDDHEISSGDYDYNDFAFRVTFDCPDRDDGGPSTPSQNTAPLITLVGSNPMDILEGTMFTDPGATSTDAEDGDLTANIIVNGNVNASSTGTYILTYSVTDSDGASASINRTVNVVPASTCEINIVSDTDTSVSGARAVPTYSQSPKWTASIPGATWIWKTFLVETPEADEVYTFERQFNISNPIASSTLTIAADNSYFVLINGNMVGADDTEFNYESADSYDVSSYLVQGSNTISFTVRNWGLPDMSSEQNPAGLLYKLNIKTSSSTCTPTNPPTNPTNTAPVITLIDSNPFTVATDTPFTDPGATSTDVEDGDLTSSIVVTGSVNASTTGSYILTYSVTDSGGLSASTTRTVLVNSTSTSTPPATTTPPTTPTDNGGNGGNGGGSNDGGSSGRSGRRHDISGITGTSAILGTSTCSYLEDYIHIDWNNNPVEVMKVQSFMNTFENESLSVTGIYDQATFDAVSRFQTKYASDILTPWGHTAPTGFVYILTKKKINEIYCNTAYPLTPEQTQEISDFKNYLESIENGTGSLPGSTIDLGDFIGIDDATGGIASNDDASSTATSMKDVIGNVIGGNGLQNLAVSFLGAPVLWGLSYGAIVAILALIGLVIYGLTKSTPATKSSSSIMVMGGESKVERMADSKTEMTKGEKEIIAAIPDAKNPENIPVDEHKDDDTPTGFKGILE